MQKGIDDIMHDINCRSNDNDDAGGIANQECVDSTKREQFAGNEQEGTKKIVWYFNGSVVNI